MKQTITARSVQAAAHAFDWARWVGRVALGLTVVIALQGAAEPVAPGSIDEISARIAPFGSLCRAGEGCGSAGGNPSAGAMSGSQVYDKFCTVCHEAGIGGAPKLGDTAAWAERTAKGMDALWASTINGVNAMPPKGTCMGCSDDELTAAVDYMLGE